MSQEQKFKKIDGVEQREVGRIGSTRIIETRSEPSEPIPSRRSLRIVLEERDPTSMVWDVAYGFKIYLGEEETVYP